MFDPKKVARAEVRMWQAYYEGDAKRLGVEIISLLMDQYNMSPKDALPAGQLLALSAIRFRNISPENAGSVLGSLEGAYSIIQRATGKTFDPRKAAKLELAWWVARRTPGQNSPEQVGQKIAELYACIFSGKPETFREAGILRARAAALRDAQSANPDWQRIEKLLEDSYKKLASEIQN